MKKPNLFIDTPSTDPSQDSNQNEYCSWKKKKEDPLKKKRKNEEKLERLERFIFSKRTVIAEFITQNTIIEGSLKEKKEESIIVQTYVGDIEILLDDLKEINILKV